MNDTREPIYFKYGPVETVQRSPSKVVGEKQVAFLRGRKMFKDKLPCPENIWTDEQWEPWFDKLELGQFEWLGYMTERGITLMKQMKLKDWAEDGGPLPDNCA